MRCASCAGVILPRDSKCRFCGAVVVRVESGSPGGSSALRATSGTQANQKPSEESHEEQVPPDLGSEKECPYCAETIKRAAKMCRFCKSELSEEAEDRRFAKASPHRRTPASSGSLRIGVGPRLGASLIDFFIAGIAGLVIGAILTPLGIGAAALGSNVEEAAILGGLGALLSGSVGFVVGATLYNLIEACTGASPGKMIIGIQIRSADGHQPEWTALLGRYLIKNAAAIVGVVALLDWTGSLESVSNLLAVVFLLGCLPVVGARRQALHDMLAGTAVFSVVRRR